MAWETREAKKAKDYERDRTKEKKRAEEQVSIDNNISVPLIFIPASRSRYSDLRIRNQEAI